MALRFNPVTKADRQSELKENNLYTDGLRTDDFAGRRVNIRKSAPYSRKKTKKPLQRIS
jgi:hypothetical protein